jgi:hypothetical protein
MNACWPLAMEPSAKAVLISLADQANDEGYCWPSLNTIAIRTCLSERTVRRALRELEDDGLISSLERSGTSNLYVITAPGVGVPMRAVQTKGGHRDRGTPDTMTGGAGHGGEGGADTVTPKPSLNHHGTSLAGATAAGIACRAMKDAGVMAVNPSHPALLMAIKEGVTPDELKDIAIEHPGKGFAYVIAVARRRKAEGVSQIEPREQHAADPFKRRRGESLVEYSQRVNRMHDERAAETRSP